MNYKEKGKLITKSRQKKGLTQAKLAEKLYITDKAVSRWETGLGMPDVSLLPSLCDILDITISGLLEENIDKTNIETEIKIKMSENEFNDFNALIEKNSVFIKQINQVDEYFTPSHRDFTKEKYPYEWISIRQRGNKNIINYKHWYPENELKSTHCDELEVEIDDVENMNKIFNVLGLKSFAIPLSIPSRIASLRI
jgi:transcriptional regulator with XRE-family HTH domain